MCTLKAEPVAPAEPMSDAALRTLLINAALQMASDKGVPVDPTQPDEEQLAVAMWAVRAYEKAAPVAPVEPASEPAALIRTWHKDGEQHADLCDWCDIGNLQDGLHKLYAAPVAPAESVCARCGGIRCADPLLPAETVAPAKPVAWIRYCSDGTYEGPIIHGRMEEVRKESGAWTPLYEAPVAPVDPVIAVECWKCGAKTFDRAPVAPALVPTPALRRAAENTRADLGQTGTNYPDVRTLLAFAEAAIGITA